MTFSFKYKIFKLPKNNIYRPLIKITFNGETNFDTFALLDSGSDLTVIPLDFAESLGLKLIGEDKLGGISKDKIDVKQSKVNITFGKGHERYNFNIPVLIPINRDFNKVIIGRAGFFNHFYITFIESEKRLEFKKMNSFNILNI